MDGVCRRDPSAARVEDSLGDHGRGTTGAFLGRLEHEDDIARQVIAQLVQDACGTDQSGNVEIVAAGVHGAIGCGIREVDEFIDGEGIHVCAQ